MWELLETMPGIEGVNIDYLAQVLAPPPLTPSPPTATPPTPIANATFSSEGSNSVAVVAQDDDDDEE